MGFKQHISRTWQMIEQQVNDVPFRPDNEAPRLIKLAGTICFDSPRCLKQKLQINRNEKRQVRDVQITNLSFLR